MSPSKASAAPHQTAPAWRIARRGQRSGRKRRGTQPLLESRELCHLPVSGQLAPRDQRLAHSQTQRRRYKFSGKIVPMTTGSANRPTTFPTNLTCRPSDVQAVDGIARRRNRTLRKVRESRAGQLQLQRERQTCRTGRTALLRVSFRATVEWLQDLAKSGQGQVRFLRQSAGAQTVSLLPAETIALPTLAASLASALAPVFVLLLLTVQIGECQAQRFVFSDRDDGISGCCFDVGLGLNWPKSSPTGLDRQDLPDGPKPYWKGEIGISTLSDVTFDITDLVAEWVDRRKPNDGLLIRLTKGSFQSFHARESLVTLARPKIIVTLKSGQAIVIEAAADASLDRSSIAGIGHRPVLLLKGSAPLALRFETNAIAPGSIRSAQLLMVKTVDSPVASCAIEIHRLEAPIGQLGQSRRGGIADRYLGDLGIAKDAEVVFADGFEGWFLDKHWTRGMDAPSSLISKDPDRGFVPLSGSALRVKIPKGKQLGLDLRYKFKLQGGTEPDEIFFRYYIFFADDWLSASQGGKLPGLAGTYGRAAWGDRPWDPWRGWSMRAAYHPPPGRGHPSGQRMMLGTYAYHAGTNKLGETQPWAMSQLAGLVHSNRWYCIEQHLKLNTRGLRDGVFRVWVDGHEVLKLDSLHIRDAPFIQIEEVWMNVFHGGGGAAPQDMHAFIDNVVIARSYIGPMRQ